MAPLSQITAKHYYSYMKNLLQITAAQISQSYWWLLQIVLIFITNYGCFQNCYKLALQMGDIINCILPHASAVTYERRLTFFFTFSLWCCCGDTYQMNPKLRIGITYLLKNT